ncbi:MAG: HEPN domain-containing protein [Dehalococcoidia bacterium]|nr:HEPN domain-containing protein [Dehalococcoidia bacterium]
MTTLEKHSEVSRRFIAQATAEFSQGDYLQASEKAWGAAAHAVKAVAETRGWQHGGHRELFRCARLISEETGQPEIRELFSLANSLHTNFYERWMDPETVEGNIESVKRLLDKLEAVE